MSFSVPVLQDEPDVAVPAGTIGEAAGILALAGELEAALAAGGIACDRVLARYWRRPS